MTGRILPSPRLPELRSGIPALDSWVAQYLQAHIAEVFEQFFFIFANPDWRDTYWRFNGNGQADSSIEVYRDDGVLHPNIQVTGAIPPDGGGTFHVRGHRGTRFAATACQSGDIIGGYGARWCYDNDTFHSSSPSSWHIQVTQNQTSTAWGSWHRFLTTPKSSTTRYERGGITDNGTFWSHDTGTFNALSDAQTLPIADARFVASGTALTGASYAAACYGTDVTPGFRGLFARGTPASPTVPQSGDLLAFLAGHGYDGSAFTTAGKALIGFYAGETFSSTNQGTYISLATTPNASTTRSERLRLTGDGRLYGTALHNNSGAVTGTTNQYIASGTYTPTLTNVANVDASTAYACQWMRVGNVVTVSGRINVDATATGTQTDVGMSLPIASNFAGAGSNECAGVAFAHAIAGGFNIQADTTNDRANFSSVDINTTADAAYFFTFTYLIL